jgi:hypothetical protein
MGVTDDSGGRRALLLRRVRQAAKVGGSALRMAGSVARSLLDRATAGDPPAPPRPIPREPAPPTEPAPAPVEPSGEVAATPRHLTPVPPPGTPDEPIRTRTLARLLAQQGHRQRALAMYEALLAEVPEDDDLRAERDELKASSAADGEAEMVSVAVDARTVWVSWRVSEQGLKRAQRLLGTDGALAVRLSVTAPDPSTVVRTEARELHAVEPEGEWVVRDLPGDARATASVGVVGGDRFVSIAHARAR